MKYWNGNYFHWAAHSCTQDLNWKLRAQFIIIVMIFGWLVMYSEFVHALQNALIIQSNWSNISVGSFHFHNFCVHCSTNTNALVIGEVDLLCSACNFNVMAFLRMGEFNVSIWLKIEVIFCCCIIYSFWAQIKFSNNV